MFKSLTAITGIFFLVISFNTSAQGDSSTQLQMHSELYVQVQNLQTQMYAANAKIAALEVELVRGGPSSNGFRASAVSGTKIINHPHGR